MPTTAEKISKFLEEAKKSLEQANKDIASADTKSLKDSLYSYTDEAQSMLNNLLSKSGVITDEEINQLDEQLRLSKKEIELAKAKQSQNKFIITTTVVVLAFVALWYITKKK